MEVIGPIIGIGFVAFVALFISIFVIEEGVRRGMRKARAEERAELADMDMYEDEDHAG